MVTKASYFMGRKFGRLQESCEASVCNSYKGLYRAQDGDGGKMGRKDAICGIGLPVFETGIGQAVSHKYGSYAICQM